MNEQETWWAGEAGNAYTARNRVDWRARIPFWADIMKFTGARSVYEVGCNAGWNLSAIREAGPHHAEFYGCDINKEAVDQASHAGFAEILPMAFEDVWEENIGSGFELIFTAGVLIHVAPENLESLMREIVAASTHYVLAIEYFSEVEEMVNYRGHDNRLWKRNYGALYQALGLKQLHAGEATGFDRCQYALLEKP